MRATAHTVASTKVAGASAVQHTPHGKVTDGREREDDERNNAGLLGEVPSPYVKRTRRSSRTRDIAEEEEDSEADVVGALVEGAMEDVETPAEDPTAPGWEEEADDANAAVSLRGRRHANEEDEVRLDGLVVADDATGTAPADFDDDDWSGPPSSFPMEATSAKGRGGTRGEDEEDEEGTMAPSSSSHRAGRAALSLDAPQSDEEAASKCLSLAFPDLAAEYTAAGPAVNSVPAEEAKTDSAEVATWRCPACAKTWKCGVFVRCILKNECPHCTAAHRTSMATVRPDLLQLWDHNRNNPFLKPEEIEANSREMAYWTCPTCRDSYTARVRDRVQDKARCPSCALLRSTSADALGSEASALQQEWHPLKNGDLRLDQLAPMDRKTKVWWLCGSCGHEWEASLATRLSHSRRSKGKSCPACHGRGTAEVL